MLDRGFLLLPTKQDNERTMLVGHGPGQARRYRKQLPTQGSSPQTFWSKDLIELYYSAPY